MPDNMKNFTEMSVNSWARLKDKCAEVAAARLSAAHAASQAAAGAPGHARALAPALQAVYRPVPFAPLSQSVLSEYAPVVLGATTGSQQAGGGASSGRSAPTCLAQRASNFGPRQIKRAPASAAGSTSCKTPRKSSASKPCSGSVLDIDSNQDAHGEVPDSVSSAADQAGLNLSLIHI